ncbi:VOC family protein [Halovulum sp. GXIMD14793]
MKLNHVALTVSDRAWSANFYQTYFDLPDRVHEDDHLLILAGPDGGLLAMSEGEPPAQMPRTSHFGFQLGTPAEVLALRDRFQKNGVEEAEFEAAGPTRVQVFDPDRHRVEVYAF